MPSRPVSSSDTLCANEWYYAKDSGEIYGPFHGCQHIPDSIDDDSDTWCATDVAYVDGDKYGTEAVYCASGDESNCVKGAWIFGAADNFLPGPYIGCANPDNDPKGSWCPTKVAFISGSQFSTGWEYCSPMLETDLDRSEDGELAVIGMIKSAIQGLIGVKIM